MSSGKAQQIEHDLALEILRGERAPGTRLPPVRALAAEHGVTPPTVQRVVDRLETAGLVSARRGSGVRVNDPHERIDLALLPLWFEALRDQPKRAARILGEFLELRRVVAAHLLRTTLPRIVAAVPGLVEHVTAIASAESIDEVARADQAFTRGVVDAADQIAVAAVFSVTNRLVTEVPHVAEALYGDREAHRRTVEELVGALAAGTGADEVATVFERALGAWDRRTVARFETLLSAAE